MKISDQNSHVVATYYMQWKLGMYHASLQMSPFSPLKAVCKSVHLSVCLTKTVLKCGISSPCLWHEPLVLGFPLQKTHGIDFLGECEMGLSKMSIKNNWFAIKINELSNTVCFLNMIIPRDGYDYKLMDPTFGKNISVVLPL